MRDLYTGTFKFTFFLIQVMLTGITLIWVSSPFVIRDPCSYCTLYLLLMLNEIFWKLNFDYSFCLHSKIKKWIAQLWFAKFEFECFSGFEIQCCLLMMVLNPGSRNHILEALI